MSAVINDGGVPYASRILTINSVTYVAEDIEVTRPVKLVERNDELGEPDSQVGIPTWITGTATLQLASTSTAVPLLGMTFSTTFVTSIGAETFWLSEIGQAETQDGDKKVKVNFRKKYN